MKTIRIDGEDYNAADVTAIVKMHLSPFVEFRMGNVVKTKRYGGVTGQICLIRAEEDEVVYMVIDLKGNCIHQIEYTEEELNLPKFKNEYDFVAKNLAEYYKNILK